MTTIYGFQGPENVEILIYIIFIATCEICDTRQRLFKYTSEFTGFKPLTLLKNTSQKVSLVHYQFYIVIFIYLSIMCFVRTNHGLIRSF